MSRDPVRPAKVAAATVASIFLLLLGLGARCGEPAGTREEIHDRSIQIERAIDKNRHLSGRHSPIPSLAITQATIAAVRPEITSADARALIELAMRSDYAKQQAALVLLNGVDSKASKLVDEDSKLETDPQRKSTLHSLARDLRLMEASSASSSTTR